MIKESERMDVLNHIDEIASDLINSGTRTQTFMIELATFCNTIIPGCIDDNLEKDVFTNVEATKCLLEKMYSSVIEFKTQ
jgi:hypothetical protein